MTQEHTQGEISPVVLLLIDVINPLDFEGAEDLLQHAEPMARNIAQLKRRALEHDIATIYVNDNFGRWRSDFRKLVDRCLQPDVLGHKICHQLQPDEDDYFVLKPLHSGFFQTTLPNLLRYLETQTVIICGVATEICVLFTASDAYMHRLRIIVPEDCVASEKQEHKQQALALMQRVLKADTTCSTSLDLAALVDDSQPQQS